METKIQKKQTTTDLVGIYIVGTIFFFIFIMIQPTIFDLNNEIGKMFTYVMMGIALFILNNFKNGLNDYIIFNDSWFTIRESNFKKARLINFTSIKSLAEDNDRMKIEIVDQQSVLIDLTLISSDDAYKFKSQICKELTKRELISDEIKNFEKEDMSNYDATYEKKESLNNSLGIRSVDYFDAIIAHELKEILDPKYLLERPCIEYVLKENIDKIFCNKMLIESLHNEMTKTIHTDAECERVYKTVNRIEPENIEQSSHDLINEKHINTESVNLEYPFARTRRQTEIYAKKIIDSADQVVKKPLQLIVVSIVVVMSILILQALIPIFYYLVIILLISQVIEIATAINSMTGIPTSTLLEPLNIALAYVVLVCIYSILIKIKSIYEINKHKSNTTSKIESLKKLYLLELNELLAGKVHDV